MEFNKKICPVIREMILTGIRKASQKLNYNNSIPEIAFPCTMHDNLHPAIISENEKFLICTSDCQIYMEMTEQHKLWLGHQGIPLGMYNIFYMYYAWHRLLYVSLCVDKKML